jgi:hypothetical protein
VKKMSTSAAIVHLELKRVLRELVLSGAWKGVRLLWTPEQPVPVPAP